MVNIEIQRGEISFSRLLICFNIFLTLFIGIVSILNTGAICKIVLMILCFGILVYFCFVNNSCKNFLIRFFSKMKNRKEIYKQ